MLPPFTPFSYLYEINTYYLGAKKMNPKLTLHVVWVMTWYDPVKEADAAKALTPSKVVTLPHNIHSPCLITNC